MGPTRVHKTQSFAKLILVFTELAPEKYNISLVSKSTNVRKYYCR